MIATMVGLIGAILRMIGNGRAAQGKAKRRMSPEWHLGCLNESHHVHVLLIALLFLLATLHSPLLQKAPSAMYRPSPLFNPKASFFAPSATESKPAPTGLDLYGR